ncbi:MAG: hypothetical protein QF541_20955, partial [Lentisphaeria bacterium]|nr:hypothetical protein [Lentisphaeria bacterium]
EAFYEVVGHLVNPLEMMRLTLETVILSARGRITNPPKTSGATMALPTADCTDSNRRFVA